MAQPNLEKVKKIADAILYEGYLLYPYRRSALKNHARWTFGRLYPRTYSEAQGGTDGWFMQTESLVLGQPATLLGVQARFLQLTDAEPVERDVFVEGLPLGDLLAGTKVLPFAFHPIQGAMELSAERARDDCFKITVRVLNDTRLPDADGRGVDAVLPHTLVSVHAILDVREGEFVSLLDPGEPFRALVAACRNVGTWPVLVGEEGRRDMMLSAPIILYDYPRVAPESPGDFFDGTEMDEMLTLRVLTLTDEEKGEVLEAGECARTLLERTERLSGEQMLRLHGAVRHGVSPVLRPGARVRLKPGGRSDAMDLILSGKLATVVSVEEDYEGRIHLAVTVDDDPGRDFGAEGKPGHRFFFRPEEVEPLSEDP